MHWPKYAIITRIVSQLGSRFYQHRCLCSNLHYEYLCNPKNFDYIAENVRRRKGVGNVEALRAAWEKVQQSDADDVQQQFLKAADAIPNFSHPNVWDLGDEPHLLKTAGDKRQFDFKIKEFHTLAEKMSALRTENLTNFTGRRSYYFRGQLAELEQALVTYTVAQLLKKGFLLMSVPDMLDKSVLSACGANMDEGDHKMVYHLDPQHYKDLCLSGTSEMGIAGYFSGQVLPLDQLPMKIVAVSRCHRAETSHLAEELGVYRVHHFTKVEMFGVTSNELGSESENLLHEFLSIQEELFSSFNLHYKVLEMPPRELGAAAYHKYDIEAWMPARNIYGEISSTSNCTDYQSRRLNIRYSTADGFRYCHTVNGTACAVPRLLIALVENGQLADGSAEVPSVLKPFFSNRNALSRTDKGKKITWIKMKAQMTQS